MDSKGSNCLSQQKFLAVTRTEGLGSVFADGIVGLNPSSTFLEDLIKAGLLEHKNFAISFANNPQITFGIDINKGNHTYYWHSILDAQYWAVRLGSA